MGAFDSGTTSGVTAGDLVSAPDIGKVAPGKTKAVQTYDLGVHFLDHGAVCDGKDENTTGCFLRDGQRLRLINDFMILVVNAMGNYKDALTDLRIEELLKEDDDLHWVVSLALDVAGAHFLGVAAKALKRVKAGGLAKLTEAGLDAARRGEVSDRSWNSRAETLLAAVTDKGIDGYTKTGFDAGKKHISKGVQSALHADDSTDKGNTLAFIAQLKNSCDAGFMAFARHATGSATDAELVVLWEGMQVQHHTPDAYKAELQEKLARYKQSGVTDIGRKLSHDRTTPDPANNRTMHAIFFGDDDAPPAPQRTPPQPAPLPKGSVFNQKPSGVPADSVFAPTQDRP